MYIVENAQFDPCFTVGDAILFKSPSILSCLLPLITLTLAVWNAVLLFHVHLLKVENVSVLTLNLTLTLTRVTFNTPDEHDFVTSPFGKSIPIQYATCTSVIWKRENSTTFPESGQLKPFK